MKKLQLILDNPCTQDWDKMQPAKAGKFCDSCAKTIIDLTTKTDTELIDFFKKKKENVCARLLSTQLNRELPIPAQKSNWYWLAPIALGSSIIFPSKSMALTPVSVQNQNYFSAANIPKHQSSLVKSPVADSLKGKVVDVNTGKPLVNVKIKWKEFKNVIAITDSSGNFSIVGAQENQGDMLVFEAAGYQNLEMVVAAEMLVKMRDVTRIILGGITSITTTNQPLYVIYSGAKSCIADEKQRSMINPDWIEKIDILKDANATALYGSKAANGVILMGIKKKYKNKIDFSKKD